MADATDLTVSIDFTGIDRLIEETPGKVSMFLDMEAEQMVNGIKQSFGTGPGGRAYKRGGVVHVASMPGFPPNVDKSALMGSLNWERIDRFTRRIQDGVEHGVHQELGTEHIIPRPFVGPEFERTRRRLRPDAIQFGLVTK